MKKVLLVTAKLLLAVALCLGAGRLFRCLLAGNPVGTATEVKWDTGEVFQQRLTNLVAPWLSDAVPDVRVTYKLNDQELVAPAPDPAGYGQAQTPGQMMKVIDQAEYLLEGQSTMFQEDTPLMEGTTINYYRDDTILAITWKQAIEKCCYTFAEVKIADASQFRRFLADGTYNSGKLYTTTEMSASVNAVLASSADYYRYRTIGVVVNDGHVYRSNGKLLDTCYIDDQGDLLFTMAKDILDEETAKAFVEEHNVRFSLSFGPVMIQNGENVVPKRYNTGEINDRYSRAALCQLDKLHYLIVAANMEGSYRTAPTLPQFAENLVKLGVETAYTLDGGQTASIALDSELVNTVSYGSQRDISDIIYFATAIPSGKEATP